MGKGNHIVSIYFEAFDQFELLNDTQLASVIRAAGRHFRYGEVISLQDPLAQAVYLSVEGAMERQKNRYESVSEKMKGNQNARKHQPADEPQKDKRIDPVDEY